MIRRMMVVGLLGMILALVACGGGQTGTTTEVGTAAQGTPGGFFRSGEMPLSMKLPAGTLLLEDTDVAVTPEQAKELLPLWQMIRTLQGSTTSSQVELEATFGEIEEAMTPEQLAAIEEMSPEDMRSLFDELGMGRQQSGSESEDEEGGGFGGPPDMGGMMPPVGGEGGPPMVFGGGEGGPGMGAGGFGDLGPEAQATALAERGGMGLGFGSGLTDAVIELLEARAAGDTSRQEMSPPEVPQEQLATATATAEPVATPAENTPTSEAAEAMETPVPTATPKVEAVQVPAMATPVVEQASTAGSEGRLVFQVASGGDIYTVNADGSGLRRVTYGMDPDLSPDGSQIAFVRWSEPWGIYTINVDGSGERLLFSSNVARAPVWSPNGTQLAFYFQTEGKTAPRTMCMEGECMRMPGHLQTEWHVGVVDVADGYLHQPYVDRFSFSPTWSADGQWLVYDGGDSGALPSENHGLCLTTVEGPNNAVLTKNTNDHYPVWSPDGTKIAFMHWKHDHWEIFIMNADGSDRHPLTSSSNYVKPVPNNVSPAWSPDGQQIVFLSDRGGKWEFYVMDADGSDQRQILENVTEALEIQYTATNERVVSWGP